MKRSNSNGFTLLEAIVVLAIVMVVTSMAVIVIPNVLNSTAVDSGYALTLGALRQARQLSMDQLEQVAVTFSGSAPYTITTQNQIPNGSGTGAFYTVGQSMIGSAPNLSYVATLPSRVQFALPTSGMGPTAPESIPSGEWQINAAVPISFTQMVLSSGAYTPTGNQTGYVVVFQPDGSARCPSSGNPPTSATVVCNGVVYLTDTRGDLSSVRAITLFRSEERRVGKECR